eukprot:GHVN01073581.1.p1 GENE.GHVN01073581.1~~GHVN01073581.1.p1  ORF type:complete len:834 (+),score=111.43 GHVN01073581.1:543-3044(+)
MRCLESLWLDSGVIDNAFVARLHPRPKITSRVQARGSVVVPGDAAGLSLERRATLDMICDLHSAAKQTITQSQWFYSVMGEAFMDYESQPVGESSFWGLFLNNFNTFLYMANYYIVIPTASLYGQAIGLTPTFSGVLLAMAPLASLVSSVAYSIWSSRSFTEPLLFCTFLLVLGNTLYAVALDYRSPAMLLIGRLLVGLGGNRAVNRRYIADFVPVSQRTMHSAVFVAVGSLGMSIGPGVQPLFENLNFSILGFSVNKLTAPGWSMVIAWIIFFIMTAVMFQEPTRHYAPDNPLDNPLAEPLLAPQAEPVQMPPNALRLAVAAPPQQVRLSTTHSINTTAAREVTATPLRDTRQGVSGMTGMVIKLEEVDEEESSSTSMGGSQSSPRGALGEGGLLPASKPLLADEMKRNSFLTSTSSLDINLTREPQLSSDTYLALDTHPNPDQSPAVLHHMSDAVKGRAPSSDEVTLSLNPCVDGAGTGFSLPVSAVTPCATTRVMRQRNGEWRPNPARSMAIATCICLWIYFVLKMTQEAFQSMAPLVTSYYFGWSDSGVAYFLAVVGIIVLPTNLFMGCMSEVVPDRVGQTVTLTMLLIGALGTLDLWFSTYTQTQYIGFGLLLFVSAQILEGVNMALISKVMPKSVSKGLFNSGFLSTEAGTSGRAAGNLMITVAGWYSPHQEQLAFCTMLLPIVLLSVAIVMTIVSWRSLVPATDLLAKTNIAEDLLELDVWNNQPNLRPLARQLSEQWSSRASISRPPVDSCRTSVLKTLGSFLSPHPDKALDSQYASEGSKSEAPLRREDSGGMVGEGGGRIPSPFGSEAASVSRPSQSSNAPQV